jgi:hypothetical protein
MPEAGTFYATLKLKNQWGCVDSIKKEITGISLIPVFSGDTLSCSSKDVVFNPNSDSATLLKGNMMYVPNFLIPEVVQKKYVNHNLLP